MDDDPEEYVQMKYSRDDEVPKGWAIRDLSTPVASKLGFYPASDFGVLTKLIQQVTWDFLFCFACFVLVEVWCWCWRLVLRFFDSEKGSRFDVCVDHIMFTPPRFSWGCGSLLTP